MTTLPITDPGIYDLPMAIYHAQCCDGPSVSSTGLRKIVQRTPAHCWASWSGNPDAEEETSPALSLGSAAHALLLGDEEFSERHVVEPWEGGRSANEDGWKVKDKRAWLAEQAEAGMIVVRRSELETIAAMRDALAADPHIEAGLLAGEAERSLLWRDHETGVWLKARPDVLPRDRWVVDYKTIQSAHPRDIRREFWKHRYDMQLALVAEGMAALGMDAPHVFVLVCQEKDPPYAVTHQKVPLHVIAEGAKAVRRAVRTFAQCLAEDRWPAYGEAPDLDMPPWIADENAGVSEPAWFTKAAQEAPA